LSRRIEYDKVAKAGEETMKNEEMRKLIDKLEKNPKVMKALAGLLEPLKKEGDSLTISADLQEIKEKLTLLQKPAEKKKVKRFDEKKYLKLIKLISNLFQIQTESVNEEWILENDVNVIDPANVCLVQAKTEEAKSLLVLFKSFESDKKNPELDFKCEANTIQKSRYSQEYMRKILEILNVVDDGVNFTLKADFPILVENKHFKFVLAPRIEQEEN